MALGITRGGMGNVAADKWKTGTTRFQKSGAREIVIRNDAGKIVGKLGVLADGGGMLMLDDVAGNPVAPLIPLSDGAGILAIRNAYGKVIAGLPLVQGENVIEYREILDLLRQTTEPIAGDFMHAVIMFV